MFDTFTALHITGPCSPESPSRAQPYLSRNRTGKPCLKSGQRQAASRHSQGRFKFNLSALPRSSEVHVRPSRIGQALKNETNQRGSRAWKAEMERVPTLCRTVKRKDGEWV
eukprot:471943-Prymnesium_polylepis.3